jgi:hypothetical protein
MKQNSYELFKNGSMDEILGSLEESLSKSDEAPIWRDRVVPFSRAILSVLIPLRDHHLLFDPQMVGVEVLTPELFFEWSDFVSLKNLLFIVAQSKEYDFVDIEELGRYLSQNGVDLQNKRLDFPIATYNLHQGVSSVIKSLL